jgi:copper chaperone
MMSLSIQVENIKCGGCANSIKKGLMDEAGVSTVEIDVENGMVLIDGENLDRDAIAAHLLKMGYPESGSVEGMKATAAKAKSFVSCAIGKVSSDD